MSNSHIPWPITSPGCPKTVPVSSPAFSFLLSYQDLGVFHSFIVLDTDFIHAPEITCSGFPKALCVLYSESSWRHIIYWVIFLVSGVISQVSSILSKEVMICLVFFFFFYSSKHKLVSKMLTSFLHNTVPFLWKYSIFCDTLPSPIH